jgi:hypothetical protein
MCNKDAFACVTGSWRFLCVRGTTTCAPTSNLVSISRNYELSSLPLILSLSRSSTWRMAPARWPQRLPFWLPRRLCMDFWVPRGGSRCWSSPRVAQAPTCGRPELRRGVDEAAEAGDGAAAVGASADHLHLIELCASHGNAHLSRARLGGPFTHFLSRICCEASSPAVGCHKRWRWGGLQWWKRRTRPPAALRPLLWAVRPRRRWCEGGARQGKSTVPTERGAED